MNHQALASFIWSVADLLRGDYKQSEYGRVILPFTVLRRLDCVLEPTKPAVLAELQAKTAMGVNPEPFLLRAAKQGFYKAFPPPGIEVVSWNVVMGIGQIIVLRLPASRLREVNRVLEDTAWGAYRTEFFPTYDYRAVGLAEHEKAR